LLADILAVSLANTKNNKVVSMSFLDFCEAAEFLKHSSAIPVADGSIAFKPDFETLVHCPNLLQVYRLPKVRKIDTNSIYKALQILENEVMIKGDREIDFFICEKPEAKQAEFILNVKLIYPHAMVVPVLIKRNISKKEPLEHPKITTYKYALQGYAEKVSKLSQFVQTVVNSKFALLQDTNNLVIDVGKQQCMHSAKLVELFNMMGLMEKQQAVQRDLIDQLTQAMATGPQDGGEPSAKRKKHDRQ